MKRHLFVLLALAYPVCSAPGCGTLNSNTVKTAEQLAEEACLAYAHAHPDQPIIDDGCQVFGDIINLVMAKPTPAAAKEALVAHPPLSAAAALAVPCLAPPAPKPIDDANPYRGPQSRVDRRLYPPIVMAPEHEGE